MSQSHSWSMEIRIIVWKKAKKTDGRFQSTDAWKQGHWKKWLVYWKIKFHQKCPNSFLKPKSKTPAHKFNPFAVSFFFFLQMATSLVPRMWSTCLRLILYTSHCVGSSTCNEFQCQKKKKVKRKGLVGTHNCQSSCCENAWIKFRRVKG
jgi:hypothetical protein